MPPPTPAEPAAFAPTEPPAATLAISVARAPHAEVDAANNQTMRGRRAITRFALQLTLQVDPR
jgi:hypothetical protein